MLLQIWNKGNTPPLLVGAYLGIRVVVTQKDKNQDILQDIPLLGICPKDTSSYHEEISSTTLTAALVIIARN